MTSTGASELRVGASRERPTRPGMAWQFADALLIVVGLVVVPVATFAFVVEPHLPKVDPRDMIPTSQLDDVPGGWAPVSVVVALGQVACAGLPRSPASGVLLRSAVGQIAAAVLAVCAVVVASALTNIWTFCPDDPCRYAFCWPAVAQAAAIALPGLSAALVLVISALLAGRLSWGVRAILPAAVWLVSITLVRLVWDPCLLPLFLAPPT